MLPLCGGVNCGKRMEIAVDELGGDIVLQVLLNLAAQIAGAVGLGIGLLDQVVQQRLVPGKGDPFFFQGVPQLAQHDTGNGLEAVLGELVEIHDLVNPVDELRTQERLQRLHGPLFTLLVGCAAEAHGAGGGTGVAARIGGHDDDGVLKVHIAALGVGDVAVVQNLQQDVKHVGMGLFDLVEQDDAVGLAAHLFGKLTLYICIFRRYMP